MARDLQINEKLSSYRISRDKATQWLLSLQSSNGSLGPSDEGAYYYRIPWTFAVVGEAEAASRFMGWLRANQLTQSGELRGLFPLGAYTSHYSYIMANLVCGAHLLGEFDMAQRGIDVLRRFADPISGGFSNAQPDLNASPRIETWISAQVGLAFMLVGNLDTAERVGEFLIRSYDLQPDISQQLYFVYNKTDQALVTDGEGQDQPSISIRKDLGRQWFYAPGMISGFLVCLYKATNRQRYLEYAQKYQDFVQSCSPKQFDGIEVCKTGWGAALLYGVTSADSYLEWSVRVGDFFVGTQQPDGRWPDDRYSPSTLGQDIALTAQNVIWLHSIMYALTVRKGTTTI